jgi:RND superfamily putative drug exporter
VTPFERLGRFVVHRAWWVVGAWAALLLIALPFAPQVPGQLSAGGFILDDLESARAKTLLESELGVPPSALVIVFTSPTLEAGTPAFETAAAGAIRDIPGAPHVARVVSHGLSPRQVSADRHTAYDIVFLDLPPDDSPDALPILRERLHAAPGLDVALAGGPAFYGDVQTVSEADLRRSELISLPLAALALIVVFGSVVAAGVPLVVGGATVIVALAGIFVVASFMPMSIFVLNLATLLGLGLGVDYSLLLTSRFREELALRPDGPDRVPHAVRVTVATAGRAIFFSGLTVLLGLLGLVLFEFMILRSTDLDIPFILISGTVRISRGGQIVLLLSTTTSGLRSTSGWPRPPRWRFVSSAISPSSSRCAGASPRRAPGSKRRWRRAPIHRCSGEEGRFFAARVWLTFRAMWKLRLGIRKKPSP